MSFWSSIITRGWSSLCQIMPLAGSSSTLNVLAGVAASQAAGALVLAVTSTAWAALCYVGSALAAVVTGLSLGRASSTLARTEAVVAQRAQAGNYQGEALDRLSDEIFSAVRLRVAGQSIVALCFAVMSIGLLMEATVLAD